MTEYYTVVYNFADKILDRIFKEKGEKRNSRYIFLDVIAESTLDRKILRY
jgi:hypothetical protein